MTKSFKDWWHIEPFSITLSLLLVIFQFFATNLVTEYPWTTGESIGAVLSKAILSHGLVQTAWTLFLILALGMFVEGCDSWSRKLIGASAGLAGSYVGTLLEAGWPHSGAPVFCGVAGMNFGSETIFHRTLGHAILAVIAICILPFIFNMPEFFLLNEWHVAPEGTGILLGALAGVSITVYEGRRKKNDNSSKIQLDVSNTDDLVIVHISDLHERWASQGWSNVKDLIKAAIKPHLVIVTGDLVNTPTRNAIRTAKEELAALKVPTFVLPGNHDLIGFGTLFKIPKARQLFGECFPSTPVEQARLSLVGFDSNSNPLMATARIRDEELKKAKKQFANSHISPVAIRLAALHHHVVSLPYASDKSLTNQDVLLLLRNSCTFLADMGEAEVDLILHGHRHKSAFLRLNNLAYADLREAPLTLLSAGSSTLGGDGGSNLNVIRIGPNCSMRIERYYYPPNTDRIHADPAFDVFGYEDSKRRFFRRFRKAQGLEIGRIEVTQVIKAFGSEEHIRKIEGLTFDGHRTKTIAFGVRSERGTLRCPVVKWQVPGEQWRYVKAVELKKGRYQVDLRDSPCIEDGINVQFESFTDFAHARDRAEATRLAYEDDLRSSVGFTVRYPTRELVFRLQPEQAFPIGDVSLKIHYWPNVITSPLDDSRELVPTDGGEKREDFEAEQFEHVKLLESGVWEVKVAFPMIGYRYSLEWPIANNPKDHETSLLTDITEARCRDFLRAAQQNFDQLRRDVTGKLELFLTEFFASTTENIYMEVYVPNPEPGRMLHCVLSASAGMKNQQYPHNSRQDGIRPGQGLVGASYKLAKKMRFLHGDGDTEHHYFVDFPESPKYMVATSVPIFHEEIECLPESDRRRKLEIEVGPTCIVFVGSTEKASYLRFFEVEEIPSARSAAETEKRRGVTPWINRNLLGRTLNLE